MQEYERRFGERIDTGDGSDFVDFTQDMETNGVLWKVKIDQDCWHSATELIALLRGAADCLESHISNVAHEQRSAAA